MFRPLLAAIPLFFLLAAALGAQDLYQRQARLQLAVIARDVLGFGWTLTHDVVTGSLRANGRDTVRLSLAGGRSYAVTATCDADCRDIDLELVDRFGTIVDRDVRADDVPVVNVTPQVDATYRVRVIMASCDQEPCRYAVGVFGL
jgi:hypothetical protein